VDAHRPGGRFGTAALLRTEGLNYLNVLHIFLKSTALAISASVAA